MGLQWGVCVWSVRVGGYDTSPPHLLPAPPCTALAPCPSLAHCNAVQHRGSSSKTQGEPMCVCSGGEGGQGGRRRQCGEARAG